MSWVAWVALAWPVGAVVVGVVLGPLLRRATSTSADGTTAPGVRFDFSGNVPGGVSDDAAGADLLG